MCILSKSKIISTDDLCLLEQISGSLENSVIQDVTVVKLSYCRYWCVCQLISNKKLKYKNAKLLSFRNSDTIVLG